jgi:hypothetical protein
MRPPRKPPIRHPDAPRLAGRWTRYTTNEISVTEKKKRRNTKLEPKIVISSADLDPAADRSKSDFSPPLAGRDPMIDVREWGASSDENVNMVFQHLGIKDATDGGIVFQKFKGEFVPRCGRPIWVVGKLKEFIQRMIQDNGEPLNPAPLWAILDYMILREYYLGSVDDNLIFKRYKKYFQRESNGEKWTSNPSAVKKRRLRLRDEGNLAYPPEPETEYQPEHHGWWIFTQDQGPYTFSRACFIPLCGNVAVASVPITGVFICKEHKRSEVRKILKLFQQDELEEKNYAFIDVWSPLMAVFRGSTAPPRTSKT